MTSFSAWLTQLKRPAVFAHRGASRRAAENSLEALRIAAELGADGVEFDVQRCGSGELVVFHDRTLARCTGAIGSITETPLAELKRLSLDRIALDRGLPPTGERIPTLDEWLGAMPASLFINLEVKAETLAETEITQPCIHALSQAGMTSRSVVSSFHPGAIARAERGIALGALVEDTPHWRRALAAGLLGGASAVHPESSLVTPQRVALWKRLGYVVATWTVDDAAEARRCFEAGVDVVISNRPEVVRPLAECFPRR